MRKPRVRWYRAGRLEQDATETVPLEGMGHPKRDSGRESLQRAGPGRTKHPAKARVGRVGPCGQHLPDATHVWSEEG